MTAQTPAAHDFCKSIKEGMSKINEAYAADSSMHSGQKPARAYVYCSDSRDPIEEICGVGPGKIFGFRNIGNSLEEPGKEKELSQGAIDWLTYAAHLGVREFVILGHGGCGCMKNAHACNCTQGHGHGEGMEAEILQKMGKSKRFATELVSEKDAADYLSKLGLPVGDKPAANHVRAITIAHAFYQQKLAQAFFEKLEADAKAHNHPIENGPIKVKVQFFDLESTPCVLYSYCSKTEKFRDVAQKDKDSECCGGKESKCCRR